MIFFCYKFVNRKLTEWKKGSLSDWLLVVVDSMYQNDLYREMNMFCPDLYMIYFWDEFCGRLFNVYGINFKFNEFKIK